MKNTLARFCCISFVVLTLGFCALQIVYWLYDVKLDGILMLEKAPGEVAIIREADTKILHIRGDSWSSISYG